MKMMGCWGAGKSLWAGWSLGAQVGLRDEALQHNNIKHVGIL